VRAYVAARPALLAHLVPPLQRGARHPNAAAADALSVRLLPMGAINWVWAVTAAAADNNGDGGNRHRTTTRNGALPACGLLVKHAPPFVRSAGPSFPLSDERLRVQATAMRWAAALVGPNIVPAPLSFDAAASALVALLLPPHFVPLGVAVLSELAPTDEARAAPAPVRLPWLPARLGLALARLYAATSPAALGREGHARARERFKNADMVAANAAVVLERPFDAGDAGNAPLPELAAAAKALRCAGRPLFWGRVLSLLCCLFCDWRCTVPRCFHPNLLSNKTIHQSTHYCQRRQGSDGRCRARARHLQQHQQQRCEQQRHRLPHPQRPAHRQLPRGAAARPQPRRRRRASRAARARRL
jgi:hypothetical protein